MVSATPPPATKPKETDWADISDDDEEETSTPTVKVDSLDLNSLSLKEKSDDAIPNGAIRLSCVSLLIADEPGVSKSLADRITSGEMTTEKKEEVDNASSERPDQKKADTKEPNTNLIQSKYEVAVKLQDMQADPNSPLYSVKSFDELGL